MASTRTWRHDAKHACLFVDKTEVVCSQVKVTSGSVAVVNKAASINTKT